MIPNDVYSVWLDATAQADTARRGIVERRELVEHATAQIDRLNGRLNAVVSDRREQALNEAHEAEAEAPFAGVPTLIKDLGCGIAGAPMWNGNRTLKQLNIRAEHDSQIVTRLRSAGFAILGRTNTAEFGGTIATEPTATGSTLNPWNAMLSPGGSSGGSGAAVSSGMVAVAHGTDASGSVRIPASACGVIGVKPTNGSVPLDVEDKGGWFGIATPGVFARTSRDARGMLHVMQGVSGAHSDVNAWSAEKSPMLSVGILKLTEEDGVDEVTALAVRGFEDRVRALGHDVVSVQPEFLSDHRAFHRNFVQVVAAGLIKEIREWNATLGADLLDEGIDTATEALVQFGMKLSEDEKAEAVEWIDAYKKEAAHWWASGPDVLVTPVIATHAVPVGWFDDYEHGGARIRAAMRFTPQFNVSGDPALSLPVFRTLSGPLGVQIVARSGRDDLLLNLARDIERAYGWLDLLSASNANSESQEKSEIGMNAVDTQPNIAVDEYWRKLDLTLDVDPTHWLNTAHEACYRWTGQNRLAIVERHEDLTTDRWSFDQLADATSRFANALQTAGVSRGDRVCGLLPQGVEAHVSALAVWQIGAIFVPVYPGFGVGGIAQRIRGAEPKVVITDHESRTALDSALGESDADPRIIEVEQYRGRRSAVDGGFWGLIDAHDASAEIVRTAASDTATLLFSSGTTGDPKGCQLAHNYLLTMKPYARHSIALNPGELIASTSSPGWVNGLYSTAASVNAEGWSRAIYTGRFDPQKWRNFLIEEQIAFFGSAPSALRAMLPVFEAAGFPDTIKAATSAGEAQGYDLVRKWFEISGLHLGDTFGTTESGLFLATGRNDTHRVEFGALPPVVPGFEVALLNEDGTSNDEMGIISVRGRGMRGCTGYLGQEAKWSERWRDDWYLTGDLARRDEKGQLWYLGRDDDLIVTSGYNVAPAEVEPIIAQHENVQDVVVLDAPDAARGSVVRAVIVPNGELSADDKQRVADELKSLVKKQLGRHVYPRIIEFTDSIPRNHAGKALRNVLRQTPPQ